jgi:hypothetical protein
MKYLFGTPSVIPSAEGISEVVVPAGGVWIERGIADGDTLTGLPQLAPDASGGVGAILVSVIGGVVGQSGE